MKSILIKKAAQLHTLTLPQCVTVVCQKIMKDKCFRYKKQQKRPSTYVVGHTHTIDIQIQRHLFRYDLNEHKKTEPNTL